jgi:hypothetical protein
MSWNRQFDQTNVLYFAAGTVIVILLITCLVFDH